MENSSESKEKTAAQASRPNGNAEGLFAVTFSILSLFILAVVFVPCALAMSALALMKKQYVLAGIAISIGLVSGLTWLVLGMHRIV